MKIRLSTFTENLAKYLNFSSLTKEDLIREFSSYFTLLLCLYIWIFSGRDNENVSLKIVLRKLQIFVESVSFMIYSKDGKGIGPKSNPDPNSVNLSKTVASKRIIFIRHGESDWNNVFNKGINLGIFVRLFRAIIEEMKLLFKMDSKFLDSPLNQEGIEQALELRKHIEQSSNSTCKILRGEDEASVIVSSTLRRAISTTTLALWPRIIRKNDKILLHSSLQEISRNIDTRALSSNKEIPDLPFHRIQNQCQSKTIKLESIFDPTDNYGNKTRSFYGIKRFKSFIDWVFLRPENTIIVGGHSLWFKYFFQTYLPFHIKHDAKFKKIVNSGVVEFIFHKAEGNERVPLYRIDEASIKSIYPEGNAFCK